MSETQASQPTAIIIFGGTGNLAEKKLLPALLDLFVNGRLPEQFVVIGLSRKTLSDSDYQNFFKEGVKQKGHDHSDRDIESFCSRLRYVVGSFDERQAYENLREALENFDQELGVCTNKLFYLAVPPPLYGQIFYSLHEHKLMELCDGKYSWSRLLVEKPFGRDLETAKKLEEQMCSLFNENQIYRIDHYLAKESIENIISIRFANSILANAWHEGCIESIDIRLWEDVDVSTRGAFYDGIGALRDVGQNHMLQIFSLLTMPEVNIHDRQAIRKARAKAIKMIENSDVDYTKRGQYLGYHDTAGVAPDSQTETYFKIGLTLTEPGWNGVKVILEAGKAMSKKQVQANVTFRSPAQLSAEHKNQLQIMISPEQKFDITMWVKKPGFDFAVEQKTLSLLESEGEDAYSLEAYERVLFDCIVGDQTRFVSGEEVVSAWSFITPILHKFSKLPLYTYEPGSLGPDINT